MRITKISNTANRFHELLDKFNLRQVDFLKRLEPFANTNNVKFGKSHLSLYLSGKAEPKQDKLAVIGMAFNVNEAWLMGYDVPMLRSPTISQSEFKRKRQRIPTKLSDKGIQIVMKMDSELYSNLCLLAEEDHRSFEEELEFLLYWSVQDEIEHRHPD